ncbi:MAG TPA: HD domain-containing phosphohydrolase [Spirochaetota bacterium]|nr:HD domain-containing phosphohydrolase [Spirochaetota bacterium]
MNALSSSAADVNALLRVLILEDSENDAGLIENEIAAAGIPCTTRIVADESSFRNALETYKPSVVLADFRLPSYDGFQALEEVRSQDRLLPFIFVSGTIGDERAIEALKRGATDYVNKEHLGKLPSAILRAIDEREERRQRQRAEEALERIRHRNIIILDSTDEGIAGLDGDLRFVFINRSALAILGYGMKELLGESLDTIFADQANGPGGASAVACVPTPVPGGASIRNLRRADGTTFPAEVTVRTVTDDGSSLGCVISFRDISQRLKSAADLASSFERMRKIMFESIHAMATALEYRDPYTAGHQKRVADLSKEIGSVMGLDDETIEGLYLAGVVHDIGKIYVPAEILTRPSKLSPVEFSMIKEHSEAGYQILKNIEFPWPIAEAVYRHHERLDGSGYPGNLTGKDIILEARILAVADVVEAMASHRPYRPSLGLEPALDEIAKNRGRLYDPAVVDACSHLFRNRGYRLSQ